MKCFEWGLCFVEQEGSQRLSIFGFSEFIAAFAILVVLFMITDVQKC